MFGLGFVLRDVEMIEYATRVIGEALRRGVAELIVLAVLRVIWHFICKQSRRAWGQFVRFITILRQEIAFQARVFGIAVRLAVRAGSARFNRRMLVLRICYLLETVRPGRGGG